MSIFLSLFTCKATVNLEIPTKAEDISPLLIGEKLPDAQLQNPDGKTVEIKEILSQKNTVLVFYRGGWCPYCNMQLSGLVKIEQEILDLDYQIVAISPDDYQNLNSTEEKENIHYHLYSDPNGKFIQDIGIAFQTPTMVKSYIATKGQKGKSAESIPVPTVMVVNKEREIVFEYINPNYKERLSGEMLLAVLKTLKK